MDLFDLFAKISLDTSEFKNGVENAEKTGVGLAQQLKTEIVNASSKAESSMGSLGNSADRSGSAFDDSSGCINDFSDSIQDAVDDARRAGDGIDDLGEGAEDAGENFDSFSMGTIALGTALGNLATGAIQLVIGKLKEMVSSVWNIDDTTREYREGIGKLETAFQMAGYGSDVAKSAFSSMYRILGDNDTATEASQLLAQLAENEQQISDWGTIAAGALGTFGDSIPIEGLIESANETAKVGIVTGVLADALNWVGISEDEFNEKLAECSDTSERTALITDTLKGQYSDAAAALEENNAEIISYNESQLAMQDSMSNLGEAVGNVKSAFMDKLAPAIGKAADKLAEWIGKIDVDAIFDKISTIVENFKFGWDMISQIWGAVVEFFTTIGEGIMAAFAGVGEFLSAVFQAANDAITWIFEALPGFFSGIWEGIKSAFATVVEFFTELFTNAWKGVQTVWSVVVGFFTGIWNGITTVFSVVVTFFSNMFSSAWNTVQTIWSAVVGFFSGIWEGIKSVFSAVVSFFSGKFSGAINGIKSVWSSITSFFSEKWESIKSVFSNALSSFAEIGSDIVQGIKNGIKNGWSKLTGWVKEKAESLLNAAKEALGIKSPSKEFRDVIGKNIPLGIGVGIEKAMPDLLRTMDNLISPDSLIGNYDFAPTIRSHYTTGKYKETAERDDRALVAAINALNNKLDNIKIYLDTGVMVGEMSTELDKRLYKNYSITKKAVIL